MTNPEAAQGEPAASPESLEGLRTQIGQYGRQLARHGRRLDQHSRELDRLQDDLRTLTRRIAAGLGKQPTVHGENGDGFSPLDAADDPLGEVRHGLGDDGPTFGTDGFGDTHGDLAAGHGAFDDDGFGDIRGGSRGGFGDGGFGPARGGRRESGVSAFAERRPAGCLRSHQPPE
ncbi:hypothetical protein [Amycolatopsis sp. 195334CR]|uniref:hypothetical protein n=1 Tax=Amycolatopsis sp. 195334CR TaxID=2814588 RepID=UPI001A8C0E5B|nr:hypothetical protein [Amycolatopsis sp. 195334CR]MBN6041898.1 hypothetical protein [Amycolatopsis sp. 195334CR]